jgi:hypothetical protein
VVLSRKAALKKLEHVAHDFLWPPSIPRYICNPSDVPTWQFAQKLAVFAGWLEYVKVISTSNCYVCTVFSCLRVCTPMFLGWSAGVSLASPHHSTGSSKEADLFATDHFDLMAEFDSGHAAETKIS